jgi:hypothetical protein
MIWPAGLHDLDSTGKLVGFLSVLVGASAIVWWFISSAVPARTARM